MLTFEEALSQINQSYNDLIYFKVNHLPHLPDCFDIYLLRKTAKVGYEGHFTNLKGLGFQVDGDNTFYRPSFVTGTDVLICKSDFENPDVNLDFATGQADIIQHLKKAEQWGKGIAFGHRMQAWHGALGLYIYNQLR